MLNIDGKKSSNGKGVKKRIYILDEIRGFAIICMVFYHALYTLGHIFELVPAAKLQQFLSPFEPLFGAIFIFISGICTTLSRSNLRRGAILLAIAVALNLFTLFVMPSYLIAFGVLNLLSFCMILYGIFGDKINRAPPVAGLAVSAALFALTWGVRKGFIGIFSFKLFELPQSLYAHDYLFPLGMKSEDFFSADYYPIFPWVFMFSSGAFTANIFSKRGLPQGLYKKHIPPLAAIGRYSLPIYILHQPIIFGLAYAIKFFL